MSASGKNRGGARWVAGPGAGANGESMKTNSDRAPEAAPALNLPTIHMNGTSKDELESQIDGARLALDQALVALHGAAPNARDYYPQGPDAYRVAAGQHRARVEMLQKVLGELGELAEGICDGGHGHHVNSDFIARHMAPQR